MATKNNSTEKRNGNGANLGFEQKLWQAADEMRGHMEGARANIRRLVKRILREHGNPPDKQEKATMTVVMQAELLCKDWAVA